MIWVEVSRQIKDNQVLIEQGGSTRIVSIHKLDARSEKETVHDRQLQADRVSADSFFNQLCSITLKPSKMDFIKPFFIKF